MSKQKREKNYEAAGEAKLRFARMPARKARLVCELIRGKRVRDAMNILTLTHKPSAAPAVLQVLKSAKANAEQADYRESDDLIIRDVFVDGAPMIKRVRPAPMGRAVRVRKRMCHITIRLNEK